MRITQLLSSTNFLVVNKSLCKSIGIVPAVVLSELCSEYEYYKTNKMLTDGKLFYCTGENMLNNLGIKRVQLESSYNLLEQLSVMRRIKKGMPCKTYFELSERNISLLLEDDTHMPLNNPDSPETPADTQQEKRELSQKMTGEKQTTSDSTDWEQWNDINYADKQPMAVDELDCECETTTEPIKKQDEDTERTKANNSEIPNFVEKQPIDKRTKYINRLKELNQQENWGYTGEQIEFYYDYMSSRNWLDDSDSPVAPANIGKHCCKALGAIWARVRKEESGIGAKEKIECKRRWEDALCKYWDTRQIDILLKDKNFESADGLDKYCEMITKTKAHNDNTNSIIKRFGVYDGHRLNENRYCEERCSNIMPRELLEY